MSEVYEVNIGNSSFSYHGPCLDKADLRNVNNRTPEEQEQDRAAFTPVPLSEVAQGAACSSCWQPLHEERTRA